LTQKIKHIMFDKEKVVIMEI